MITMYWYWILLVAVVSYLIGSISFSIIFSKGIKHSDIRQYGSGNAGTTNMFRTFGMSMGVLTFICDACKAVLCCMLAKLLFYYIDSSYMLDVQYVAAVFVVVGHIFSVFYRAKGGKGLATSIGVIFCVQPVLALCMILPLIAIILLSDRMSIMALVFALFIAVWHWVVLYASIGILPCIAISIISLLIIVSHRQNIARLVKGIEPQLGIRRKVFGNKSTSDDDN